MKKIKWSTSANTFNYYQSLAKRYKNLSFIDVSIAGVSSKSNISNDTIKLFNTNLSSKVSANNNSNLVYK